MDAPDVKRCFGHSELIPAVEPEELAFAIQLASSVDAGMAPSVSPSEYGLVIDNEDGTFDDLTFGDTRENRVGFAIAGHLRETPELFHPIMTRMRTLMHIWHSPRMEQWVNDPNPDSEKIGIKTEVFHVAASMMLNMDGLFDEDQFFERVQALVDTNDGS